ncbi:MAG: AAA family ATPase, partial [Armatimonadetes bacterium]|nr:AAA family ATPase [Armatimonadota bacterium]NIM24499.1 AAA family ATPase [Armatimonadota bacterium]NIM68371.1 AAA family ATPase [Armatimonadota bacterium]NIN06573.1 AAA family ATPase [Armatimonadota bacterium]NIO98204.1 AAA family ATPase [Armatimonadota bacterium]
NTGGEPEVIQKVWDDNLADVRGFIGRYLDVETHDMLQSFGRAFILKHEELLRRRIRERRIRDGHGDLHCEHICFAPEGIQIFDCIEFSPKLRYGDVASEVAFLMMDMELRGADFLARQFLERYVELTKDPELSMLLPYFKCHRALVRGKVTALRSRVFSQQAAQYFDYARRLIWGAWKPTLVLIGGLSGSGKSTLSRALSERTGWPVVSSDATRKDLAGISGRQDRVAYGEGIYSASMSEMTYQNMAEQAEAFLARGQSVILDATFLRGAQRERMSELAGKKGVPILLIW